MAQSPLSMSPNCPRSVLYAIWMRADQAACGGTPAISRPARVPVDEWIRRRRRADIGSATLLL